jgi:S-disulfanyl-L-cysteine oxidoreductase SoxD
VNLALKKLIGDYDTMNADTLPKVRMPNRDGFIIRFPEAL